MNNVAINQDNMDNPPNETRKIKLFMSLVLPNQRGIYAYILSMVIHPYDADDLLQDTLALMWKKFDEFVPGTDFLAWGKVIARYKVMNYFKKNKNSKLQFDNEVLDVIESDSRQMDNLSDRLSAMKKCLSGLSEREQAFLKFRYYEDFSFKKIALSAGISKQSAYRTVGRIHSKLVKCIKQTLATKESYGH